MQLEYHVATAGWSLRKDQAHLFPPDGTHLQKYASRFSAVEINSSFYRPHQPATYQRWADAVPEDFRFSVKMPKSLTHEKGLAQTGPELTRFLKEISGLGPKLGGLLVSLPSVGRLQARQSEGDGGRIRLQSSGHLVAVGEDR